MGILDGRVAICTGSGRGVGAEVAKLMAKEGASIIVNDPGVGGGGEGGEQGPAEKIANEINAGGGKAAPNFGSVSSYEDCLGRCSRRAMSSTAATSSSIRPVSYATGCSTRCLLTTGSGHGCAPERPLQHRTRRDQLVPRARAWPHHYGRLNPGLLGNIGQANYGAAKLGIAACALSP